MMYGITGTPGTGKSAVADILIARGYPVLHLSETAMPYAIERDEVRDTLVIDTDRWVEEFIPVKGFVEGHLAHLLPCDRVIVLRCRPDLLRERLSRRGYHEEKIRENVEAEALDVILCETMEYHPREHIFEIDTTGVSVSACVDEILGFVEGKIPPNSGNIDWSWYLVDEV
jgi:adenylate kinase